MCTYMWGGDRGGLLYSVTVPGFQVDSRVRVPEQVPVYVWAAEEEGQFQPGRCSRWWLHQSLRAFEGDLAALGGRLVYRRAPESRVALLQLVEETGAQVPHAPVNITCLFQSLLTVRDARSCPALPQLVKNTGAQVPRCPAVRQFCQTLLILCRRALLPSSA